MIDVRLFPLLEALGRANLDWLVQEVLNTVVRGEVPLESQKELIAARQRISDRQEISAVDLPDIETVGEAREFSGDEQVRIAGSLVVERIGDVLLMMKVSMARLDEVVEGQTAYGMPRRNPIKLEILDQDQEAPRRTVTLEAMGTAFEALTSLREAIEIWEDDAVRGSGR